MPKIKPKDIIALTIFLGIITLRIVGKDGGLDTAGALIIGYYFGHRESGIDNGN